MPSPPERQAAAALDGAGKEDTYPCRKVHWTVLAESTAEDS